MMAKLSPMLWGTTALSLSNGDLICPPFISHSVTGSVLMYHTRTVGDTRDATPSTYVFLGLLG
jgi:hypothetical protein